MKYPTEAQKAEAIRLYNKHRDKLILKYLRKLRREYKHAADAFERNDRLRKYNRMAEAYWKGRIKRDYPFITPRPARPPSYTNYIFKGPGSVLDTDDPHYGLLPEGYYYLLLGGREYDRAVTFEVDEETRTLFVKPYNNVYEAKK